MYQIVRKEGIDFIQVGDFVVGDITRYEDGTWCAAVRNKYDRIGMQHCSTKRSRAVEGLIKQMVYEKYNDVLEDK